MMRRLFVAAPLFLAIAACSSTPGSIYRGEKAASAGRAQVEQTLKDQKPLTSTVAMKDDLWVGGAAIQLTERDVLPDFFRRQATFYQLDPVSFQEIVSRLSAELGTRVVLAPDAIKHLRDLEGANDSDTTTAKSDQDLINIAKAIDGSGKGLVGDKVAFTLQHQGTVESLLDLVTSKANLFWRWDKTHITIYRHVTETFVLDALPGKSTFGASVASASSNESGSSSSLSSHSTKIDAAPESAYESIAKAVTAMTSGDGRFALSEQVGTLTVTDTPPVIEAIKTYVNEINGMMNRKVAIRTEIYEVMVEDDGTLGMDWEAIYQSGDKARAALATLGSGVAQGLGLEVIREGSRWNGSKAFISALQEATDLSLVTSSSVYTVNGQPVPVQVVDEHTYLASITSETSTEGGLSNTTLEPGVVTSGVSMSLMPRISSDGDIMMQVAMDLSQLNEITEFGTDAARIQLPSRSTKNFLQRVSLRSGETLMVSGFERTESNAKTSSILGKKAWMLGGKKAGGERKVMTLILITPYLMAR